jgi:hypothetical protein
MIPEIYHLAKIFALQNSRFRICLKFAQADEPACFMGDSVAAGGFPTELSTETVESFGLECSCGRRQRGGESGA